MKRCFAVSPGFQLPGKTSLLSFKIKYSGAGRPTLEVYEHFVSWGAGSAHHPHSKSYEEPKMAGKHCCLNRRVNGSEQLRFLQAISFLWVSKTSGSNMWASSGEAIISSDRFRSKRASQKRHMWYSRSLFFQNAGY